MARLTKEVEEAKAATFIDEVWENLYLRMKNQDLDGFAQSKVVAPMMPGNRWHPSSFIFGSMRLSGALLSYPENDDKCSFAVLGSESNEGEGNTGFILWENLMCEAMGITNKCARSIRTLRAHAHCDSHTARRFTPSGAPSFLLHPFSRWASKRTSYSRTYHERRYKYVADFRKNEARLVHKQQGPNGPEVTEVHLYLCVTQADPIDEAEPSSEAAASMQGGAPNARVPHYHHPDQWFILALKANRAEGDPRALVAFATNLRKEFLRNDEEDEEDNEEDNDEEESSGDRENLCPAPEVQFW